MLGGRRSLSSDTVYHDLCVHVKHMSSFEMPQELVFALLIRSHSSAPIVLISLAERICCKGTWDWPIGYVAPIIPSSEEEAPTPKKNPKTKQATVKIKPYHNGDEPPFAVCDCPGCHFGALPLDGRRALGSTSMATLTTPSFPSREGGCNHLCGRHSCEPDRLLWGTIIAGFIFL